MTGTALLLPSPAYPWYALLLVALAALAGRAEWLPLAAAGYLPLFGRDVGLGWSQAAAVGYLTAAAVAASATLARAMLARSALRSPASGVAKPADPARCQPGAPLRTAQAPRRVPGDRGGQRIIRRLCPDRPQPGRARGPRATAWFRRRLPRGPARRVGPRGLLLRLRRFARPRGAAAGRRTRAGRRGRPGARQALPHQPASLAAACPNWQLAACPPDTPRHRRHVAGSGTDARGQAGAAGRARPARPPLRV